MLLLSSKSSKQLSLSWFLSECPRFILGGADSWFAEVTDSCKILGFLTPSILPWSSCGQGNRSCASTGAFPL